MDDKLKELRIRIAAQLEAGMCTNPNVYTAYDSDNVECLFAAGRPIREWALLEADRLIAYETMCGLINWKEDIGIFIYWILDSIKTGPSLINITDEDDETTATLALAIREGIEGALEKITGKPYNFI